MLQIVSATPEASPSATPLVFVHGAWHALWCWEEHFLPFFAQAGYTVHAFDLRGTATATTTVRSV